MQIGRYQVLGELARGGMGVVYRAHDASLRRDVAIKLLLGASLDDPVRRERAHREALALAKLNHPNIVSVHETGEHQGSSYLVMELVPGETLEERIQRGGPLDMDDAAELIQALARALIHAHGQGILHRDLKPDNVILSANGPMLTDFGLARDLDASYSRLTQSGTMMGTPGYWAPEQAMGDGQVDPRTDVYGLGATLYAALTGVPPIEARSFLEHAIAVQDQPPVLPSRRNRAVDRGLESVCLRCIAKEPAERYRSAAELDADLERYLSGERTVAEQTRPAEQRGLILALVAAVVLLGGVALGLSLAKASGGGSADPAAERSVELERPQAPPEEVAAGRLVEKEGPPEDRPSRERESEPDKELDPVQAMVSDLREQMNAAALEQAAEPNSPPSAEGELHGAAHLSYRRGEMQLHWGRAGRRGATRDFQRAVEAVPECGRGYVGLGRVLREDTLDEQKALEIMTRGYELDPGDPEVRFWYARQLTRVNRNQDSLAHFDFVIERGHRHGEAHRRRAETHHKLGNLEAALADYDVAIAAQTVGKSRHKLVNTREEILRALGR